MRWNKKASLEIGVNTIVILVIAMILLGLGIGFVRGIFGKANTLPDIIDPTVLQNPPTAQEPIMLSPTEPTVRVGDSASVNVGVYNREQTEQTILLRAGNCAGGADLSIDAIEQPVPPNNAVGYRAILSLTPPSSSGGSGGGGSSSCSYTSSTVSSYDMWDWSADCPNSCDSYMTPAGCTSSDPSTCQHQDFGGGSGDCTTGMHDANVAASTSGGSGGSGTTGAGKYICNIEAYSANTGQVLYTKQFILNVEG